MNGDRDPIEDADEVTTHGELDIEAKHTHRGWSVVLRWQLYTAWHDSNHVTEEIDPFEVELDDPTSEEQSS